MVGYVKIIYADSTDSGEAGRMCRWAVGWWIL